MDKKQERSCYECHNFRAKIPLVKDIRKAKPVANSAPTSPLPAKQAEIMALRLKYAAATASCRCGHLLYERGEESRVFRNVLRAWAKKNLLAYQAARTCIDYVLDD